MTLVAYVTLLFLGAGLLAIVYFVPGILAVLIVMAPFIFILYMCDKRREERLVADRQGESIGSFARSFDYRAIDTWIIRAVYEELQFYCRYPILRHG